MPNFEVDEAARLLTIADRYFAQASAARALAAAIDQRRISLTTRLDPCVHRHLPRSVVVQRRGNQSHEAHQNDRPRRLGRV